MSRPHPKHANVDTHNPNMWTTSDRDGFIRNQKDMAFQWDWSGSQLINKHIIVGADELDVPQVQLRTIVPPPDPPPKFNARPEPYVIDETDWRTTQDDEIRSTQDDELRVTQPSQYEADEEDTG